MPTSHNNRCSFYEEIALGYCLTQKSKLVCCFLQSNVVEFDIIGLQSFMFEQRCFKISFGKMYCQRRYSSQLFYHSYEIRTFL